MKPTKREIALHKANNVLGVVEFRKRYPELSLADALRALEDVSKHIPPGRPGGKNTVDRKKTAEIDHEKIAIELAQRVIWALKYLRTRSSRGASVFHVNTASTQPWEEWFFDALDMVGYHVDRKKFYAVERKTRAKVKKKAGK